VVGIHHAKITRQTLRLGTVTESRGVLFSTLQVDTAGERVSAQLQAGAIIPSIVDPSLVTPLGSILRSELSLALSKGARVTPYGFDPNRRGRTITHSKCERSILHDEFLLDAETYCGEARPLQVPDIKGRMIGGVWQSGYQHSIMAYSGLASDYQLFNAAILDYLNGVDELDCAGYAPLSTEEALKGIPGSVIGPINLSTSAGPPHGGVKTNYMTREMMSPKIYDQIGEIEELLAQGFIPIVVAECTPKDEPVSRTKNETADIRIFNVCPVAWNIVLKKYVGPIKAFMRANPFFFESMVGIDMTRDGGRLLRERFLLFDPLLANIVEGDYKKMDKSMSGLVCAAVAEVFKRMAEKLGLRSDLVHALVISNFQILYSIQGDLYQIGGSNPSGSDLTVEVNAVANSLCHRMAWFESINYRMSSEDLKESRKPLLTFRKSNALVTYGDDFLLVHVSRVNLPALFQRFSLVNFKVTDGKKRDLPDYLSFSEVSFLKRQFIVEGEEVYCPLALKSIYRMLMIRKESKLPVKEHMAIVLEEAMREIFLHRELDFNSWRERFIALAEKYDLFSSRYLRLLPKETYQSMWEERNFSTWVSGSELAEIQP
jgi:hypothetical protein